MITHSRSVTVFSFAAALAAGVVVAAVLACGGEGVAPVGRLSAEPAMLDLPYPGRAEIDLTWAPSRPLGDGGDEATVFVHLLDDSSAVVRTFDHPFPEPWKPDATTSYPLTLNQSLLGPPLPPGEYRLTVGLYGPRGRWPLEDGDEVGRQEYAVARVRVPEPDFETLPELDFDDGWEALQPGLDRQVLATRWLGRGGTVEVGEAAQAGRLTFVLEIPPQLAGTSPVFAPGAEIPRLTVTSTCDDGAHSLSGTRRAEITVDVPLGGGCRVSFEPNFHYATADAPGPRSVRLLQLFWQPRHG
jgi:hypothetical protein